MKPNTHNRPITNIDDALAALEQLVLFFVARAGHTAPQQSAKVSNALNAILNYVRVL